MIGTRLQGKSQLAIPCRHGIGSEFLAGLALKVRCCLCCALVLFVACDPWIQVEFLVQRPIHPSQPRSEFLLRCACSAAYRKPMRWSWRLRTIDSSFWSWNNNRVHGTIELSLIEVRKPENDFKSLQPISGTWSTATTWSFDPFLQNLVTEKNWSFFHLPWTLKKKSSLIIFHTSPEKVHK